MQNLKNLDGLFGRSDPFLTISRLDDAGSLAEFETVVYTSSVIPDDPNPRWPRFRVPLNSLANSRSGEHSTIVVFKVWDHDQYSKNDLIGQARCSLEMLQSGTRV